MLVLAIVLMAGAAQAALLQGTAHCWADDPGTWRPGTWEYDCMSVWGYNSRRCIDFTCDGSGIIGYLGQTEVLPTSLHKSGNEYPEAWQCEWWNTRDGGTMGYNDPDLDFLIYAFGGPKSLSMAYLWPGSQNDHSNVSIKDFNLWVSPDPNPIGATWTQVGGTFRLNQHPTPGADIPAQAFPLVATNVRMVMIDVVSAWHEKGWAGLSEAAFAEAPAHLTATPLSGSTIDFGDVLSGSVATLYSAVSLTNDGAGPPIQLEGAVLGGPAAAAFSIVGGNPNATIAQGSTEAFDLRFTSGALPPGVYTADITFNNDSPEGPVTYHLTANVVAPVAEPAGLGLLGVALLALSRRRS